MDTVAPLSIADQQDSEVAEALFTNTERRSNLLKRIFLHAAHNIKSQWKILVFGQVLSFLLACTGATQSILALNCNLSAPTFTVGLFYFGLTFCLIPVYREGKETRESAILDDTSTHSSSTVGPRYSFFGGKLPLEGPPSLYLAMALMDVYANYFTVLAFKYTTITSVTLFDALAIPSAMILSKIFLARDYAVIHFLGVFLVGIGIAFNILQDFDDNENSDTPEEEYPHKLRGDIFAILAGVIWGASNVLGEVAVRNLGGVYEYLGMMGFFATIICTIQTIAFERHEVAEFFGEDSGDSCSRLQAWWLLFGFTIASILGYLGGAKFLQISEATFFSISLLTGDLWSVTFAVIVEHITPHPLFYGALVFIVTGVVVYETAPTPVEEDRPFLRSRDWKETDDDEVVDFQSHDLELEVHFPGIQ